MSQQRPTPFRPLKSTPAPVVAMIGKAKAYVDQERARAEKNGWDYIETGFPLGFETFDVAIYEKLASRETMREAWEILAPVFDDSGRLEESAAFAAVCVQAMRQWSNLPRRTTAEHRAHFEKIASDLMELAFRIISEPDFGAMGKMAARLNPVDMVEDDEIQYLLEQLDAHPEDGKYVTEENRVSYSRFVLQDVIPTLYAYFDGVSKAALQIAKEPAISARPNRPTAGRTYFIRRVDGWLAETMGDRLSATARHKALAAVASSLFDEPTSPDNVRHLVSGVSEDSREKVRPNLPYVRLFGRE